MDEYSSSSKRKADDISNSSPCGSPSNKPKITSYKTTKIDHKNYSNNLKSNERWISHSKTEHYVNFVSDFIFPDKKIGTYGYNPQNGRFPIEKLNALGYLLCPLRSFSPAEKWSPFEIAVFEAAITLYGKNFHQIHKIVKSKTTKEVIEFYYDWKKTSHYKEWKKSYIPDLRDIPVIES